MNGECQPLAYANICIKCDKKLWNKAILLCVGLVRVGCHSSIKCHQIQFTFISVDLRAYAYMCCSVDLLEHRTGCIICMDYSDYNREYSGLIIHFKTITDILLNKMIELRGKGFRTRDAYFFGFSYGARLITRAALEFGSKPVGTIHCEQKLEKCRPQRFSIDSIFFLFWFCYSM